MLNITHTFLEQELIDAELRLVELRKQHMAQMHKKRNTKHKHASPIKIVNLTTPTRNTK